MDHRHLRYFVAIAGEPTVVVIDDDEEIREGLQGLLGSVGLRVELFASVQEFLGSGRPDCPGCLVLDVRLPGRSGLDFHDDLARANAHTPEAKRTSLLFLTPAMTCSLRGTLWPSYTHSTPVPTI